MRGVSRDLTERLLRLPATWRESQLAQDLRTAWTMPSVDVDLMYREAADNAPFYRRALRETYRQFNRRHPKLPLIRRMQYGVALCEMPQSEESYFRAIEAAGRRNWRKANRKGYRFARIHYNDHLDDIAAIHRSKVVRQGRMPEDLLEAPVRPIADPPSRTRFHDYAYFGVLDGDELVAYAGCFAAGEAFLLSTIYGHGEHERNGVVPLLVVGVAGYAAAHYPAARYYVYDTFFGASERLRRFKKKFLFHPHHVRWHLG